MTLQARIDAQPLTGSERPRHLDAEAQGLFPIPEQGAHDLEPPVNRLVWPLPAPSIKGKPAENCG
jgi:NADH-quinone oxidoreductase subunit B